MDFMSSRAATPPEGEFSGWMRASTRTAPLRCSQAATAAAASPASPRPQEPVPITLANSGHEGGEPPVNR